MLRCMCIVYTLSNYSKNKKRGTKVIFNSNYSKNKGNWHYCTTFTLTQEAVDLESEGYGFKLHVPEDSLPPEVSETQLSMQIGLSGQFQLPPNCELISAVYWVSSPHKFMKPVTVEIHSLVVSSVHSLHSSIPSVPRRNFLTSSKRKWEESSVPTVPMAAYLYPTFLG